MLQSWQDGYLLLASTGVPDTRSLVLTLSPSIQLLHTIVLPRTAREVRLFPHTLPVRVTFDRDPDPLAHITALEVDLTDFTYGDIVRADAWTRWQLPQDGTEHELRLWRDTLSPVVLTLQYIGVGTAAVLTLTQTLLAITITGGPGGEDVAFDLTDPAYSTLGNVVTALDALAAYTCALASSADPAQATAYGFPVLVGVDILTTPFVLQEAMLVDIALVLE
jgi:hypothetical protein